MNPDHADAYVYRAQAYSAANRDSELIIKDYSKAIELNPHHSYAYTNRARAYRVKGKIDPAIEDLSIVIELNPNSASPYVSRAEVYIEKNEINLAIADYSKVIELMPDEAQANYYFLRGIARLRIQDWKGGIEDLTASQDRKLDIGDSFSKEYKSITDFEEQFEVKLPKDIAAILTQSSE